MKIFVFGWYGRNNLGDEVFKISFQQLWPEFNFTFGNKIPLNINEQFDALWLGGGSFLDQPLKNIDIVIIPIYFIGVGVSSIIPTCNRRALDRAKLIICRDNKSIANVPKDITFTATDLVFARSDLKPLNLEKTNQITVILNDFLTPVGGTAPDWMSLSYYWFLQEFSKIMDRFISQDYKIKLIPMCINPRIDDRRIAAAVQGRSTSPYQYDWHLSPLTEIELRTEISKSAFVVTQRFHGMVYSIIEQAPCVTICAHDKFNSLAEDLGIPSIDYYGLTDTKFREVLNNVMDSSFDFSEYIDNSKNTWRRLKNFI